VRLCVEFDWRDLGEIQAEAGRLRFPAAPRLPGVYRFPLVGQGAERHSGEGTADLLILASAGDELGRLGTKFPTAALATLMIPNTTWPELSEGDAVLAAYVVPKQLGSGLSL
jgi:hypothetical protein